MDMFRFMLNVTAVELASSTWIVSSFLTGGTPRTCGVCSYHTILSGDSVVETSSMIDVGLDDVSKVLVHV